MFGSNPFDAVLDAVGTQDLVLNSPVYLKVEGVFISVGAMEGGIAGSLWSMFANSVWPRFLGGTPRKYLFQQTTPNQERMKYLIKLVEDGKLRVVVDQIFEMEDALRVSWIFGRSTRSGARAYQITCRHMRES
jgi:NADPH:quinone reductase-like Zn-dependent oxidoreductase